jgi:hypothetical protein
MFKPKTFKEAFKHQDILSLCQIKEDKQEGQIIIECPNPATAGFLSKLSEELVQASYLSESKTDVILNVSGVTFDIIPGQVITSVNNYMLASAKNIQGLLSSVTDYDSLLEVVCKAPKNSGIFITLVPSKHGQIRWEWGMPLYCIQTNSGVQRFEERVPFYLHGADVTLLYDRNEIERQMAALTKEFEQHGQAIITDFEYETYLPEKDCPDIRKDPSQKFLYNADLEMRMVEGLGLIRGCYCKDKISLN